MDKKWYMSKKFWTPIVMAAVVMINGSFGINIPEEQVITVAVPFIIYLIGEFFLDRKREGGSGNPLQDPAVRDAIESMVADYYDYRLARADGIEQHSTQVRDQVLKGLEIILDPKTFKKLKGISEEVTRVILKSYREDQKMQEGADLVMASMNKKEGIQQ